MLTTISKLAVLTAVASAALSAAAFSADRTTPMSVTVGAYEIRNADRGLAKRVKVFHDGQRIATIVLRRGQSSSYCCAPDSCKEVETLVACTTFKMTCDKDGACSPG